MLSEEKTLAMSDAKARFYHRNKIRIGFSRRVVRMLGDKQPQLVVNFVDQDPSDIQMLRVIASKDGKRIPNFKVALWMIERY